MLNLAFQCDYDNKEWKLCTDTDYIEGEIEDLPCTIIVEYRGDTVPDYNTHINIDYVFCPRHNTMEDIEKISGNQVTSFSGCTLRGIIGKAVFYLDHYGKNNISFVPYRWRVFQRRTTATINIACDVLRVESCRNGIFKKWLNFAFSVDFLKNKVHVSKVRNENHPCEWTQTDIEIPDIVVNYAIDAMRECTFYACGIKPSVLSQMKGKKKIQAYLDRPFDLNIVFLKQFLKEFIHDDDGNDIFDEIFPRDQKDNYKVICNLLDINPPKSLRKAYSFNPYSIVWYMIFKQWNINDINFIQRFFYLDDCIFNKYLYKFYFDRKNKRVTREPHEYLYQWEALEFFCNWVKEQKGEKYFVKWLYHVSAVENPFNWQADIIMAFYDYHDSISEESKKRLLSDGLTDYVHNAISMEVTALSEKWEQTRVYYDTVILRYECKINDCEFRLVHNTGILPALGSAFNNCVATYRQRVLDHNSIIVYAINKSQYVACIEIDSKKHIVQASGKYNAPLKDEVRRMCCYWAQRNNLVIDIPDMGSLSPEEMEEYNDAIIESIPYEKAYEEMELEELRNLEVEKIYEGYYTRLEQLLNNTNKYPLSAPYWMEFADEISRLTYLLPEGERIFKAAGNGNTEAMIALGRMYFRGRVICQDYDKSLEWLERAGQLGNLKGCMIAHKVRDYMNRDISERDRAILLGLSALRHRAAVGALG